MASCPFDLFMLKYDKNQIQSIADGDEGYPKTLLAMPDHPKTLYYIGDITLLNDRLFTVVGSRRTPAQALKLGEGIAKELSIVFTLVTGVADGGDSAGIEGALLGGGRVICVLAGGFSAIPQNNLPLLERVAKKGLILALHDYDTPVRNFSYEYRNKVLATMGEGVLVLGAPKKSGALITARHAWKQKKPVFALPYFPGSLAGEGCNAILKAGGTLTECGADVLKKFGLESEEREENIGLSQTEEQTYLALKELGEGHISELSEKAGLPVFKAKAVLSALEVKGLAINIGGNRYTVVK